MRPVEVHKYQTPTRDNVDCPWSLGILNLTNAEAEMIATFARGIRGPTSPRARGLTATDMREIGEGRVSTLDWRNDRDAAAYVRAEQRRRAEYEQSQANREREEAQKRRAAALQEAYEYEQSLSPADKRRIMTGLRDSYIGGDWAAEPAKKPAAKPEEPRNRFSGLDIE